MSHIGKKTIVIPEKTEVSQKDGIFSVKGPLGEISRRFVSDVDVLVEGKNITVKPNARMVNKAVWGTTVSHIANMIEGVTKGFEKKLIIEGIGFKADVKGSEIVLSLGFSHPVKVPIPSGISVKSEKGTVTITGINKEQVGGFAAELRDLKKPEPYKGKGIRYEGEVIKRKQGKKAGATAA